MIQASERLTDASSVYHMMPSLIEVMHTMKMNADAGAEGCCECAN